MDPKLVNVHFGHSNVSDPSEPGFLNSNVSKIIIHPDWDSNSVKYDADIALVVLKSKVEFNNFIRPVCLPPQSHKEITSFGYIVGWGKTDNSPGSYQRHSDTLQELQVPAINASHCYSNHFELAQITSNRMFCAGFDNENKGACSGDAGGGFYTIETRRSPFVITGIISTGLLDQHFQCNVNVPQLFTNVGWFVDWINEKVSEN